MKDFHFGAWSAWLMAAMSSALLARAPQYLILLLLVIGVIYARASHGAEEGQGWKIFIKTGIVLTLIAAGFNTLVVHAGNTVLFRLPALVIGGDSGGPQLMRLQLGGAVTLESLAYGFNNALSLIAILLVVGVYNFCIDYYQLLRYVPASMYQTGLIATIALTFIPQMVTSVQEISEAQALRGQRIRKLQDLLPLFSVLLTESLDRAINLAESMESRGFGTMAAIKPGQRPLLWRSLLAFSVVMVVSGVFGSSYFGNKELGGGLIAGGIGIFMLGMFKIGQIETHARHQYRIWRMEDTLLTLAACLSLALLAACWLTVPRMMTFYPYPKISSLPFHPLVGISILLLLAPLAIPSAGVSDDD